MLAATTVLLLFNSYALHNINNNETTINYDNGMDYGADEKSALKDYDEIEEQITEQVKVVKKKEAVKLNMKQGLIMNQVLSVYALTGSTNELCRNQSLAYQQSLRAFEPWALQMFDASSKLQSGILAGNLMEYGSFKQCIAIYSETEYGPITGKNCVVRVQPTTNIIKKLLSFRNITEKRYQRIKNSMKDASLQWSVCIPDSCTYEDVNNHFNKTILSVTEGLNIKVSVTELDCYALSEEHDFNSKEKTALIIIFTLLGIISLCTTIDLWQRGRKGNNIFNL